MRPLVCHFVPKCLILVKHNMYCNLRCGENDHVCSKSPEGESAHSWRMGQLRPLITVIPLLHSPPAVSERLTFSSSLALIMVRLVILLFFCLWLALTSQTLHIDRNILAWCSLSPIRALLYSWSHLFGDKECWRE